MRIVLVLAVVFLSLTAIDRDAAADAVVYDALGKEVFSLVPTGQSEEVVTNDGRVRHQLYRLTDLETGATYTYSPKWQRTMSDGGIYMDYHFNKRQWYWVEDAPVQSSSLLADRIAEGDRRRTYRRDENRFVTPDQGDYPILRYTDGSYIDEMGRPVYSLVGSFPESATIVLLHKYYEQVYHTELFDEIKAFREAEAVRFAESNSLAQEIVTLGNRNESSITTLTGKHYHMLYFTEIEGQLVTLSSDQVVSLKNKWLQTRNETKTTSSGLRIPRATYRLTRKEAKARGFADVESTDFVLELKPAPEYLAEFEAAISRPATQAAEKAPTEAAVQAKVDGLSVGILAGALKPGLDNGFRTAATFEGPRDIAVDSNGNVFIVDGDSIRKITTDGRVSTMAGGARGDIDGTGITARFGAPSGIAIDQHDNLYVADTLNRTIRKVSPDGYVGTLAGQQGGYRDGWGPDAQFESPRGIAVDRSGNVYVGDEGNRKIRKVRPDGTVTTLANNSDFVFLRPRSLAVDDSGFVYVLDGAAIKRIGPDESVSVLTRDLTFDPTANAFTAALFRDAGGIAIDAEGNLLVSLMGDHAVVRINPAMGLTTVAENNDGFWLGRPSAVAVRTNGNLYLADNHNKAIHQVTPAGNTGPLPGMVIPQSEATEQGSASGTSSKMSAAEAKTHFDDTKKRSKKDPQAMYDLAHLYRGRGDEGRATSSIKKAAKAGHAAARYELALLHLDGTISYGLTVVNGDVAAGKRKQMAKRQAGAAELFEQSANQGYMPAQYALALAYFNGEGVARNAETAIEWMSKAGEQGHFDAQFELAERYQKGDGVPEDLAKAAEWYGKAAEHGHPTAEALKNALIVQSDPDGAGAQVSAEGQRQADTGLAHYTGAGAEQDFEQAAEAFKQSALLGNTMAQTMLGVMYRDGVGVDRHEGRSLVLLTLASDLGYAEAQFQLASTYERGHGASQDAEQTFKWYYRAAEQGHSGAQFALGYMYYHGLVVKDDPDEARRWFWAAAQQGDPEAQYMAGVLYLNETGSQRHIATGTELLRKAADQGHIYAAGRLARMKAANIDSSAN